MLQRGRGCCDKIGAMEKKKTSRAGKPAQHTRHKKRPTGKAAGAVPVPRQPQTKAKSQTKASPQAKAKGCKLCAVFGLCGGCTMLDLPYKRQLIEKQQYVIDLFAPLVDLTTFRRIKGMEDPLHYRNKVMSPYAPGRKLAAGAVPRFAEGVSGKGSKGASSRAGEGAERGGLRKGTRRSLGARHEVLTGMYAKGTHKLVPTDSCALENETAKAVTLVVRDLMRKWGIEPYDEDTGTGFMRHAVVRVGHASGEVLVTLVTNEDEFPSAKSFCRELVRRVPAITTVVQNVNTRKTNVILGEKERVLYGPGFILDTLCGLSFRISSTSFYQVNVTQTEVLYETAVELADLRGDETVIDAYCGTGTIGLVAAKRGAGRVIGVDNVEAAIRDARQNAVHNGIENAEFMALDAGAFMTQLAERREEAGDLVLLMDPPRAGSTERFLDAAVALAPSRIVYISCNPVSQARDVDYLVARGYRVEVVQPVDMFPHTDHVECICKLVRVSSAGSSADDSADADERQGSGAPGAREQAEGEAIS